MSTPNLPPGWEDDTPEASADGHDKPTGDYLGRIFKEIYERNVLRSVSPRTRTLYAITFRKLEKYLGRLPTTADLNDSTINGFASWRRAEGVTPATVNRDLCNLLAFWRWCSRKKYVETWPDVKLDNEPRRTPRALTRSELGHLLKAARDDERWVGGIPGSLYWPALFLVMWDTGERVGAVLELTWDRVDLTHGWVEYKAEHRKGGKADNALRIARDTKRALAKLPRTGGLVFPFPYSDGYIYRRVGAIFEQAGLPNARQFKFHILRKSMASHLEAAGGNATEALGHSYRRVTKAYLDPRITNNKSPVDLLFRPEDGDDATEPQQ